MRRGAQNIELTLGQAAEGSPLAFLDAPAMQLVLQIELRPSDGVEQFGTAKRLLEYVDRALAHRRHRVAHIATAGYQDDPVLRRAIAFEPALKYQSVEVGKTYVDNGNTDLELIANVKKLRAGIE